MDTGIALAILALFTSFMAIGGETWKKSEPKYLKRLTWRGWISCILLLTTAILTGIREKEIKITQEAENKQLAENMTILQDRIQESNYARFKAESRQQVLLEQLITVATIQRDTLLESQKKNRKSGIPISPQVAALESTIGEYKEELRTVIKTVSSASELKTSSRSRLQPAPQRTEIPASTSTDGLRVVADSFHIQKKEPFLFQIERLSTGKWQPLYPQEVHIDTSGKWYPIDGGQVPSFGLKGKGNIDLQITDLIRGGSTKCSVFFED